MIDLSTVMINYEVIVHGIENLLEHSIHVGETGPARVTAQNLSRISQLVPIDATSEEFVRGTIDEGESTAPSILHRRCSRGVRRVTCDFPINSVGVRRGCVAIQADIVRRRTSAAIDSGLGAGDVIRIGVSHQLVPPCIPRIRLCVDVGFDASEVCFSVKKTRVNKASAGIERVGSSSRLSNCKKGYSQKTIEVYTLT